MQNVKIDPAEQVDSYCYSRIVDMSFDDTIVRITEELKKVEFGVVTEINVADILKKRMDVAFRRYTILGACNPAFALKIISEEPRAGTMLPCSIVVQEITKDSVEVSVIDPVASLMAIKNEKILPDLIDVQQRLRKVLAGI